MITPLRIGALISGEGSNLQAILDACRSGAINGRVVFVGADNPAAGGLLRAAEQGIPTFVIDYTALFRTYRRNPADVALPEDFHLETVASRQRLLPDGVDRQALKAYYEPRAAAESALLDQIHQGPFDLLVLAGFMRNLSPYFIDRVNVDPEKPRIMNIHPALLPAFPGTDGYGDTFRYGCRVGGCTVHFVDYGEDTGPIIAQRAFAIEAADTLESVRKKGLRLEWELYPECIQYYAEGRLEVFEAVHTRKTGAVFRRRQVWIRPLPPDVP